MKLNYSKTVTKSKKNQRAMFDKTPIQVDLLWNDFCTPSC